MIRTGGKRSAISPELPKGWHTSCDMCCGPTSCTRATGTVPEGAETLEEETQGDRRGLERTRWAQCLPAGPCALAHMLQFRARKLESPKLPCDGELNKLQPTSTTMVVQEAGRGWRAWEGALCRMVGVVVSDRVQTARRGVQGEVCDCVWTRAWQCFLLSVIFRCRCRRAAVLDHQSTALSTMSRPWTRGRTLKEGDPGLRRLFEPRPRARRTTCKS